MNLVGCQTSTPEEDAPPIVTGSSVTPVASGTVSVDPEAGIATGRLHLETQEAAQVIVIPTGRFLLGANSLLNFLIFPQQIQTQGS